MFQTIKTAIVFLVVAPFAAGCGSRVSAWPTAPAPVTASSPSAQPVPATFAAVPGPWWTLTRAFKSVTCQICSAGSPTPGSSFNWWMAIEHSGESLHLTVTDRVEPESSSYDGTLVAASFAVTGPSYSYCTSSIPCETETVVTDHVSGHFSEDGRTLTGEEAQAHRFSTGEVITFNYEWHATRID